VPEQLLDHTKRLAKHSIHISPAFDSCESATMASNKKRDDLGIELNEIRDYESPPASPMSSRTPMMPAPSGPAMPSGAIASNPIIPVLSYCVSSIMMTVTNKFVLSGTGFNLNFFLLCVQVSRVHATRVGLVTDTGQSVVCVLAIQTCKTFGIIQYRDFNTDEARKCKAASQH